MTIKEYRRKQMQSALKQIVFPSHIEIEGVLLVLELMKYHHFSVLLGIANQLHKIKGMRSFLDDYRCQEQVNIIFDVLDRSGPIDKFFSIFTKKNERDLRREFVSSIIEKMKDRLEEDRHVFDDDIFEDNLNEVDCLSSALKYKKKRIRDHASLYNIENKDTVVRFLEKNYSDLRRLCYIPNEGFDIVESRERFLALDEKLDDEEFEDEEKDILDSKFVYDGITFFISSDFYSGFVSTTYSFIAAAIMAVVFTMLSLTGTALAIATVACTAVFLIFIPMIMTSGVKTFVDWLYNKIKSVQEYKLSNDNEVWKEYLIEKGIFHKDVKEKWNYTDFDSKISESVDSDIESERSSLVRA